MEATHPEPAKAYIDSCPGRTALWRDDSTWAQNLVSTLPGDLASSLYKQYVFRWEKYVKRNGQSRSANIWLRRQVQMITSAIAQFPTYIENLRNEVKRSKLANDLAAQCHNILSSGSEAGASMKSVFEEMMNIPNQWGFTVGVPMQTISPEKGETPAQYGQRVQEVLMASQMARLISDDWWARKLEIAYKRFCEHCRIIAGKVRKGVSAYLSRIGLRDYKERKLANKRALAQMIAKNEITGEEIALLEAVEASVSNPEIRRHELMVRMRGFEDIAQEQGLMGGFFTATAPSKYHAFIKDKKGKAHSNRKYAGANPKQTNQYLGKVWSRARAKLNRLHLPIIGFRVCEPHHDGTPHWHMLFFFRPEHEQLIRFVLADYFTREERSELRVSHFDIGYWASCFVKETGQLSPITDHDLIEQTAKRISPRFDYKAIDPEKGSATGYIAKYIAKNVDGFKVEEDEEAGMAANVTAEAVTGWASEWGIRQFQQIGGPPVSIWRELRRLEQDEETKAGISAAKEAGVKYQRPVKSFLELKAEKPLLEVARVAADSGSWSMFIAAMGGLFCPRKEQPLRLIYKPQENKYGEAVAKLKGITNHIDLTMISRADGWVIAKKGAASAKSGDSRAPWSSVNNCTEDLNDPLNEVKRTVFNHVQRNGIEVDIGGAAAIARGDKIRTNKGEQVWLDKTDIGLQLRISKVVEEYEDGWPGWDYEEIPEPEPERTYADIIKSIPVHAGGFTPPSKEYWTSKK
ncbi:hypothetical protein C9J01_08160 [Photobacterium rosenbergii]|uniref:Replication gene A protein-like domain-containing protein n=1 Tax=Photobacterium rosenbergii TaxID=294936 RepID=A0A2T3NHA0_9GAMM|nr:replication endonuclease [Photobacterium rosenbergii]PSW14402.1 hypothetical protein C9J01_08160 [Photobacterium rosenbergii]